MENEKKKLNGNSCCRFPIKLETLFNLSHKHPQPDSQPGGNFTV